MEFGFFFAWHQTILNLESVLPYVTRGAPPETRDGGATLSSDNQVLKVWVTGRCADTYFVERDSMWLDLSDNDAHTGEHLLPVNFLDEPDYFTGACLTAFVQSNGVNQTNK